MKYTFLFLFLGAIIFSSCQRCVECSYTYDGVLYSSGEQCGAPRIIKELEDEWMNTAEFFNTTATCE